MARLNVEELKNEPHQLQRGLPTYSTGNHPAVSRLTTHRQRRSASATPKGPTPHNANDRNKAVDNGGFDPENLPHRKHRDSFDASKHTKHPKFWFYDGSIVLNVEDTLFRVHKTILATHCEVFDTVFSIPQQASLKEERIEECAVVNLTGDKAEDVNDLLNALYFSSHFDQLHVPEAEPDAMLKFVSGILRLSTKYLNHTLRKKCISILHSYIPVTFEEYKQHAARSLRRFKSDTLMACARLAQETNVPTILPYLFYCIARLSPQRILKGDPGDICWRDKTICQIGRERLRHAEMSMSHSFLLAFVPAAKCKTIFLCSAARGPHAAWHSLEGSGKSSNPLKEFGKWKDLNVCEECIEFCKDAHKEGRTAVWECLPALFEMERWEVLKKREDETLCEDADTKEDSLQDTEQPK
ncbi:hypothetical protein E1B28_002209 [Marasmius oreades]|uniref:BTB domain-containing protein n=1 Tax=Marasmius oreades TaxID=181124 RepID=A0A9P7UL20_9AGAR|nr:uncharacterized protein E1B28_002209 [Marasmius oreades]KAG7086238.1 hypothetical protein E1B28_002209 [Marasmius oreades]